MVSFFITNLDSLRGSREFVRVFSRPHLSWREIRVTSIVLNGLTSLLLLLLLLLLFSFSALCCDTVVVSMDVVSMDVTMTVTMTVTMVGSVVDLRHGLIHRGADDVVGGVKGDATFWAAFPLAEANIVDFL